MNKSLLFIFVFAGILFSSCGEKEVQKSEKIVKNEVNPAHVDFDLLHSDKKAIEIADKVMTIFLFNNDHFITGSYIL